MQIIDTHSHIYVEDFDSDIEEIIKRAGEAGVEKILLPNIDVASIERLNRLALRFPKYCLPMMGLHPTSVEDGWVEDLQAIRHQFEQNRYIAVGEIGIDLHWDKTREREQREAFEEQLRWSIDLDLPVSIHSREAVKQCIKSIERVGTDRLRGVFHSFGGNADEAREVLALKNFMIGINGTVTYKKTDMPQILCEVDLLSRIVVETDAPYLTPVPFRGKRNEPSYTMYIIEKLAEVYNKSLEEIGKITTDNAKRLFGL